MIGGAVNGEGAVTIEVKATGEATYLSQVIAMVKAAQNSRSRTQDLATRAATGPGHGLPSPSGLARSRIGSGLGKRHLRAGADGNGNVIACPHALGSGRAAGGGVSTSLAAKNGLLIRDRAAFERARDLNAVVFDKTGT